MVKLTENGEEYLRYGFELEEFKSKGITKNDIITAINHVSELESMDLGDEVYLFLAGVKYGKKVRFSDVKRTGGEDARN